MRNEMTFKFSLPDDDPTALTTICAVLHHRNDLVPSVFSGKDILRVAIVADKYDYLSAIHYAASSGSSQRGKKIYFILLLPRICSKMQRLSGTSPEDSYSNMMALNLRFPTI